MPGPSLTTRKGTSGPSMTRTIFTPLNSTAVTLTGGLRRRVTMPKPPSAVTARGIVFTSTRNGDPDICTMNAAGSNVRQLTHELGYDGGPFFSFDRKKIVCRAQHPTIPEQIADYKALLAKGLIRPRNLEIWVMHAGGSNKRQVTHNGAANFAPFFHLDGKRIIFRPIWPTRRTRATSISTSSV